MIRSARQGIHDRWANLPPALRFVLLLAAAVLIGWVAVSGPYQGFRSWRMRRNLVAAQAAVAKQSMQEARDRSLTALRADATCLEAYRILERATASLRDPWHSEIARALLTHPDSSDADRLSAFSGLAPEVPLGLLKQSWSSLPDRCRQDLRFVTAFADRLLAERCCKEATLVLLAVPKAARTQAVERRLIQVLIRSDKPEAYDEAQRMIVGAVAADSQEITASLDLLEEIPVGNLQPILLEPLRPELEKQAADAVARAALMLARLDYTNHVARRPAILEDAIARWKDHEPEALARFLGDLGLHQLLLDTLPLECVGQHPALLPRMLEAIARSGAWERADPLLNAHGELLPKFELLAYRAVAAAKAADAAAFVLAWTDAKGEAKISRRADAFLTLHRIARDATMVPEAEQALVEAIRCGRGPLPLYADLKPLLASLAQHGHDKTLLEICAIYLPFESTNPVLLTQLAYLASLNQTIEPKMIVAAMEHLGKGFPTELPIQCVLATAYLCDNQPAMAAETLDRLRLIPAQLGNGYRAAYLTTQVLTGRIASDDPRITGFPWSSLLPCERKKYSDLLRAATP